MVRPGMTSGYRIASHRETPTSQVPKCPTYPVRKRAPAARLPPIALAGRFFGTEFDLGLQDVKESGFPMGNG